MNRIDVTAESFELAKQALLGKGRIQMVNLLRYRSDADYGGRPGFEPCSGREAYHNRYAPAFTRIAAGKDYKVIWVGSVAATLVAPANEAWNEIVIVEYASLEELLSIVESPEYRKEANPHRRAALEDWRFIATLQNHAG